MSKLYWFGVKAFMYENGRVMVQQLGTHEDHGDLKVVDKIEVSKSLKGVYGNTDGELFKKVLARITKWQADETYAIDFSEFLAKYDVKPTMKFTFFENKIAFSNQTFDAAWIVWSCGEWVEVDTEDELGIYTEYGLLPVFDYQKFGTLDKEEASNE